eukprot:scaffold8253_cov267-Pinguiococcus_pyrenoidosus.AAC.9
MLAIGKGGAKVDGVTVLRSENNFAENSALLQPFRALCGFLLTSLPIGIRRGSPKTGTSMQPRGATQRALLLGSDPKLVMSVTVPPLKLEVQSAGELEASIGSLDYSQSGTLDRTSLAPLEQAGGELAAGSDEDGRRFHDKVEAEKAEEAENQGEIASGDGLPERAEAEPADASQSILKPEIEAEAQESPLHSATIDSAKKFE